MFMCTLCDLVTCKIINSTAAMTSTTTMTATVLQYYYCCCFDSFQKHLKNSLFRQLFAV